MGIALRSVWQLTCQETCYLFGLATNMSGDMLFVQECLTLKIRPVIFALLLIQGTLERTETNLIHFKWKVT